MASLNVASVFGYHGADAALGVLASLARANIKLTRLKSPSRHGAVRSTLFFDPFRTVVKPRCARTSWKVTSMLQRPVNRPTIFSGANAGSVL